jgi:iron(II)-dependent oxidoreductase
MGTQPPDLNLVKIHSDAPETDSILFGYEVYADTLANLITNPENETPLVIGIYGSWGQVKLR